MFTKEKIRIKHLENLRLNQKEKVSFKNDLPLNSNRKLFNTKMSVGNLDLVRSRPNAMTDIKVFEAKHSPIQQEEANMNNFNMFNTK